MSIPRITPEIIEQRGVVAAPDILAGTPNENKAIFDRLIREEIAGSVNAVLDAWDDYADTAPYDTARNYKLLNKVTYQGGLYQCLASCVNVPPTDAAHWLPLAAKGANGDGSGDMLAAVYDPQGKNSNIFAYVDQQVSATPQWINIPLTNATGYLEYCIHMGMVHVRGKFFPVIAFSAIATLPAGFRPKHNIYLMGTDQAFYYNSGGHALLFVDTAANSAIKVTKQEVDYHVHFSFWPV